MQVELILAWRNVFKNKRRTVLTLLTVMVGCGMIIWNEAFHGGAYERMISDAVELNAGHIQVHENGYWENRSIDYSFVPHDSLLRAVERDPRIAASAPRIHAGGLLSFGTSTQGAMIQAVDPERDRKVSTIYSKILKGGRYLLPDDGKKAVMGEVLAQKMGLSVGDEVTMISQGFDGSIAAANLEVVGLFKGGNPEYDANLVIIPCSMAKETFSMMGFISSLTIRLKHAGDAEAVRSDLAAACRGKNLEILGWRELMPELAQMVSFKDASGAILNFILSLIIAFGILNTLQMSIYERIREFGIMLALGTTPAQIRLMVLVEAVIIALMGITLGAVLGSSLSIYFQYFPLDYRSMAKELEVYGVSATFLPAKLTARILVESALQVFIVSFLFSIMPARNASRLRPVEAIRHL